MFFIFAFGGVCANAFSGELSYGISILRRNIKIQKITGSDGNIKFDKEDFLTLSDKKAIINGIVIRALPEKSCGTLYSDGCPVYVGEIIDYERLDGLVFESNRDVYGQFSFEFSPVGAKECFECELILTEER